MRISRFIHRTLSCSLLSFETTQSLEETLEGLLVQNGKKIVYFHCLLTIQVHAAVKQKRIVSRKGAEKGAESSIELFLKAITLGIIFLFRDCIFHSRLCAPRFLPDQEAGTL